MHQRAERKSTETVDNYTTACASSSPGAPSKLDRYTRATAAERAAEESRRLNLGDL